jgi:ElaB/YqjD/DUF883 family membrane-anchored ribosome-binding protein
MAQEASQIRDEIAQTRAELAETVQALGDKADVKGRIRETVAENTAQLQRKASEVGEKVRQVTPDKAKETLATGVSRARSNPPLVAIPIAFLAGLLLGRRIGRRR